MSTYRIVDVTTVVHSGMTIVDVIAAISKLSDPERRKGIHLFANVVFKSVLQDPNTPQLVRLSKIQNLFANDRLWIGLLINAGFYQSSDSTALISDPLHIRKVKLAQNCLLQLLSNNTNNNQTTSFDCICGSKLFQTTPAALGYAVGCDLCGIDVSQIDTIYHCPQNFNSMHKHGYDVCIKCTQYHMGLNDAISTQPKPKVTIDDCKGLMDCQYFLKFTQIMNQCYDDVKQTNNNLDVELGSSTFKNDNNKQYTEYTLIFHIGQEKHLFRCRYSELFELHQILLQNDQFSKAYQQNPAKFQANKVSNDTQRGQEILNYFKILISNPLILQNEFFHKCINLPLKLQKLIVDVSQNTLYDNVNINDLLNCYHHMLTKHNSQTDFQAIFDKFNECNITKCNSMRRHYRTRNRNEDQKDMSLREEIVDQIHCHFIHSFDMGYALSSDDRQRIQQIQDQNVKKDKSTLTQVTRQIFKEKDNMYTTAANDVLSKKFNQLQQAKVSDLGVYSFGYHFYYWPYFKNNEQSDTANTGYRFKNWYVDKKFGSFQEEIINNKISSISKQQWIHEYNKASLYHKMEYAKTIKAISIYDNKIPSFDTSFFCIKSGDPIKLEHLLSIILYCKYSELSYKFSKTFRKLDQNADVVVTDDEKKYMDVVMEQNIVKRIKRSATNINNNKESDDSLKKRHSSFWHFGKFLKEAVYVFNDDLSKKYITQFYHGTNEEMLYGSLQCAIFQPLSTTSEYGVAFRFSAKTGLVLELTGSPQSRYFDCAWLSKFPNERELLFVLCKPSAPLTITNITDVKLSKDYRTYIQAITIIHGAVNAIPFASDIEVYTNSSLFDNNKSKRLGFSAIQCGAKQIPPILKIVTINLIKYQLKKTDNIDMHIEPYIEKLLNHVCDSQQNITIHWNLWDCDILDVFGATGGYQGYKFLQYLLYDKNHNMINLNALFGLFPNTKTIVLSKSMICEKSIKYTIKFLDTDFGKQTKSIMLYGNSLNKKIASINDIVMSLYIQQARNKGWTMTHHRPKNAVLFANMAMFDHLL